MVEVIILVAAILLYERSQSKKQDYAEGCETKKNEILVYVSACLISSILYSNLCGLLVCLNHRKRDERWPN